MSHPLRRIENASVPHAWAAVTIAVIGLFYALTLRHGHIWGGDFSLYILHARNIAEGLPYATSTYVFDPSLAGRVPPPGYPPIYPLLLAPTILIRGGVDLALMKLQMVLFFAMFLAAAYATLERHGPRGYALIAVALLGLSPYFWDFKERIQSDIPFALFAYLALLLSSILYAERASGRRRWGLALLVGAVVYAAIGTRTLGVTLIPTLLLFEALRFRAFPALGSVTGATAVALYGGQRLLLGSTSHYGQMLTVQPVQMVRNLYSYPATLRHLFDNGVSEFAALGLAGVIVLLALYGFAVRLKRAGPGLLEVFAVVYMAPLVIWPYYQGRFLIPLIPIFFLYMLVGARHAADRLPGKARAVAPAVLAGLLVLSYAGFYVSTNYGELREGIGTPGAQNLFEYVRQHAGVDELYIFHKPRVLALYTGARSADYVPGASESELWSYFARIGATRVIVDPEDGYLAEVVAASPDSFSLIHDAGGFRVYDVSTSGPEEDEA